VKTKFATALFWRVLILGFLQLGLNPTIFRVSRVSLDSINRLINIEKHTQFWRRIYGSQGSNFFGFILFPLFYFMKMISINIMCN
jgi:hypothetical protein